MRISTGNALSAVLCAAGLALAGCSADGLAFRQDHRVEIIEPRWRSTVSLPVTLRWSPKDDALAGTTFGVFIDHAPMPPGEDLNFLARRDRSCQRTPGCPDRAWLEARQIYTTTATTLRVDELTDTRPRERADRKERHEVVIVLLDRTGRRKGEAAFYVEFFLRRR